MTTDTDKIEELARWFDDAVYLVGNKDKAEFLRSLSIELTEWKIRCAELEQNAEHIQSSDEAEDLKRVLADCSAELALKDADLFVERNRAEKAKAQVKMLVEALSDLKSQVDKFCETEGEADFYTGKAEKALAKIKGQ